MKRFKSRREKNFVSQYLENISRKALEDHPDVIKKFVKNRPGVYALYRKNKLYYIGLATNISSRLKNHFRDRHAQSWDSFSIYLTVGDRHLHEIETLLLRIIDKKGNKKRGRFGKAVDLRKELAKTFKQKHKRQMLEIFGNDALNNEIENNADKAKRPLAKYITHRFHIRLKYKKKIYVAHVRKGGSIKFAAESAEYARLKNKIFQSPSLAAREISGHAMNGWNAWLFERAPGDWVPINELRR